LPKLNRYARGTAVRRCNMNFPACAGRFRARRLC